MVNKYIAVFPYKIRSLPPQRQIHFEIQIILGAQPFFKPPYHMALAELKKLKVQLEDLLSKGYIWPGVSPQGAHVLFVKMKNGTLWLWHRLYRIIGLLWRIGSLYLVFTI